jgi:hypothetical protein
MGLDVTAKTLKVEAASLPDSRQRLIRGVVVR